MKRGGLPNKEGNVLKRYALILADYVIVGPLVRCAGRLEFRHLENYGDLHRSNMNHAFTKFESP
jgi:hypothetical protein